MMQNLNEIFKKTTSWVVFATLYFICNLLKGPITKSVCSWPAFPAKFKSKAMSLPLSGTPERFFTWAGTSACSQTLQ